jgi:hypothetical protein
VDEEQIDQTNHSEDEMSGKTWAELKADANKRKPELPGAEALADGIYGPRYVKTGEGTYEGPSLESMSVHRAGGKANLKTMRDLTIAYRKAHPKRSVTLPMKFSDEPTVIHATAADDVSMRNRNAGGMYNPLTNRITIMRKSMDSYDEWKKRNPSKLTPEQLTDYGDYRNYSADDLKSMYVNKQRRLRDYALSSRYLPEVAQHEALHKAQFMGGLLSSPWNAAKLLWNVGLPSKATNSVAERAPDSGINYNIEQDVRLRQFKQAMAAKKIFFHNDEEAAKALYNEWTHPTSGVEGMQSFKGMLKPAGESEKSKKEFDDKLRKMSREMAPALQSAANAGRSSKRYA